MLNNVIHRRAFAGPVALTALILSSAPGRAQSRDVAPHAATSRAFATVAPAPWQAQDPADSLYRAAREALNDEDYRRASRLFLQITDRYPRSTYAAQALYFRAFALYRLGRESDLREALDALEAHKSRFPGARTTGDALTADEIHVADAVEVLVVSDAGRAVAQARLGPEIHDNLAPAVRRRAAKRPPRPPWVGREWPGDLGPHRPFRSAWRRGARRH